MENARVTPAEAMQLWKEKIDRRTSIPMYLQLKKLIQADIDSGALRKGDMLPPETMLSVEMSVSRPTVRQCMRDLVHEGYLYRVKGKGTFVTEQKIEMNYVARHERFEDIIRECGYAPSTKIIAFDCIDAVAGVNERLQIAPDEPLIYLKRLFYADGEPMLFSEAYLSSVRFADLPEYPGAGAALYETLKTGFHTPVWMVRREITATNASPYDAQMLSIARGRAICLVYNLAFDENNRPIEYSVSRYRSEKIKFTNYMKC